MKGILVAGVEDGPTETATGGDAGAAAFLHGPAGLFDQATQPTAAPALEPDLDETEPTGADNVVPFLPAATA